MTTIAELTTLIAAQSQDQTYQVATTSHPTQARVLVAGRDRPTGVVVLQALVHLVLEVLHLAVLRPEAHPQEVTVETQLIKRTNYFFLNRQKRSSASVFLLSKNPLVSSYKSTNLSSNKQKK